MVIPAYRMGTKNADGNRKFGCNLPGVPRNRFHSLLIWNTMKAHTFQSQPKPLDFPHSCGSNKCMMPRSFTCLSIRYAAQSMAANLANSDGCSVNPRGKLIQRRAPFAPCPRNGIKTIPMRISTTIYVVP